MTDRLIARVLADGHPVVFMLWGAAAQKKKDFIEANAQAPVLILTSNHPSPLSALRPPVPFIGCGHFQTANEWLREHERRPVRWGHEDFRLL